MGVRLLLLLPPHRLVGDAISRNQSESEPPINQHPRQRQLGGADLFCICVAGYGMIAHFKQDSLVTVQIMVFQKSP